MSTHVPLQTTSLSKTLLAHIAFIRSLVRVNTHVEFQFTRFTKTLLAHIHRTVFVRVNTHVLSKPDSRKFSHTSTRTVSRSCEYAVLSNTRLSKTLLANPSTVSFVNTHVISIYQIHETFSHTSTRTVFVRVNTHVPFQITRFTKLLAHITLVRFLVRVNTHVGFQMTRLTKTLLAHIAFIRSLVRVNTHVAFQITRFTKTLLAHIALVRFLVRVNTHVTFQMTRFDENAFSHTSHSYGFSFV